MPATLKKASQKVDELKECIPTGSPGASLLRDLFELSKKHKQFSEDFLAFLTQIKDDLISDKKDLSDFDLDKLFEIIKNSLTKTNTMFAMVKTIFKIDGDKGLPVDDEDMITFLSNFQKSQRVLKYLASLLPELIKMKKISKEKPRKYSDEELNKIFNKVA